MPIKVSKDTIVIREIEPQDNAQLEQVIRGCFHEFEIPLEGTAYSDTETPMTVSYTHLTLPTNREV